jgi:hypothetical protein
VKALNRTRKSLLLCAVIALAVVAGGVWTVAAEDAETDSACEWEGLGFPLMRGWGRPFGAVFGSLSEDQRSELASEIQGLISSKLEEWGVEPPEPILSEEQRDELRSGIDDLREAGATPEEIREYVAGKLEEWGVDLPEPPMYSGRFQGDGPAFRGRRGCRREAVEDDTS